MHNRNSRPTAPARPVTPFHRGPSAQPVSNGNSFGGQGAPNAALLIDFDNVTMGIRSDLELGLKNLLSSDVIKGKVSVRRAYADWRRYPQYIVPLTESSIDLIFAPAYGSAKKNATDIRLAIDALELVFTRPEIGTFVLLSGDSDFSSMVIKLKEYGKYVIGVGIRESASELLVMNCDEYYSYNHLAGFTKAGEDESTRWDPWQLATEAVTRMKRNGDVMRSDRLKQVMQEIDSSFDEKDLGYSKFSRFVQDAAQRGLLRTTKLENGQLEVDAPLQAPAAAAAAPAIDGGDVDAAEGEDSAPVTGEFVAGAEPRSERPPRDRDDRGRRGRRGRGRERGGRDREPREGEARETPAAAERTTGEFPAATPAPAPIGRAAFTPAYTPVPQPSAPAAPTSAFGDPTSDHIGRSGEKLTRSEAFDLVKRAVEALVSGEETTTASAVRRKAYEILGRDSDSLSARNFERMLSDSHDADMIDLRRRGHDFEVARAAMAAPIAAQLETHDQAHKAAAAANAPPPAPRGMAHRGVGGRAKSGRGGPAIDPSLLMVGVVGGQPQPAKAPAAAPAPVVAEVKSAPAVPAPAAEPASTEAPRSSARGAKSAAKNAGRGAKPAPKPAAKPAAKTAAKAPAKTAAKKAAPAKAPAKKAAKSAKKS